MESTVLQPQTRVLQHVPRWGIIRTIRQQSVAEHSYYVALYATYIAKFLGMKDVDVQWVTQYALVHDFGEMVSGDIPTPYKKATTTNNEKIESAPGSMARSIMTVNPCCRVSGFAKEVVHIADLFEAMMYLVDELNMGNQTVLPVMGQVAIKLNEAAGKMDEALLEELCKHTGNTTRTRLLTEFGLS